MRSTSRINHLGITFAPIKIVGFVDMAVNHRDGPESALNERSIENE